MVDNMIPLDKAIFSIDEIAKICNVTPRTVGKWFDSGRLAGYRIPTTNIRRVPRKNLISFLKEHNLYPDRKLKE